MSRQKNLLIYLFLVFPARLTDMIKSVSFVSAFIKASRNEAFRDFLVNFIKWLPWKQWPSQKF